MAKKIKPTIKRLNFPLWFHIVFFLLTVVGPLVVVMVEGYQVPSTAFRWTFGVVSSLAIAWSFVHKFLLTKFEEKWRNRQGQLEHDYEIDVGDPVKIKWLWYNNEMKLSIFTAIKVGLYGTLLGVIITEIATGLMKVRSSFIIICICYVSAYLLKFLVITIKKGTDNYEEDE